MTIISSLENTLKNILTLCESRFCALGKLGLINDRFYFSRCEIPSVIDVTAILLLNLPHTILSEIRPPTC